MQENEPIKFKPVNDGLGFHPFSDGLPYEPHSRNKSSGTGAVAAGPARAVPAIPRAQPPVKTQSSVVTVPSLEVRDQIRKVEPPTFQKQWIEQKVLGVPTAFYPLKRLMAFIIDSLVSLCLASLGLAAITELTGVGLDGTEPALFFIFGAALFFSLSHVLITLQDLLFSTSFGKHFVGLEFHAKPSKILLRSFLLPLSLAPGGLGILYMFFDSKKRMLHDVLSGAQPVEK